MARGRQAVTLKDIAVKTGYSVNTVSRALRDKDDIADGTKKKIRKIAAEMGHVNNMMAASLRLGYTNSIAVILGDVSNPYFSIMMNEIELCAWNDGYTTVLFNTNENEQMEFAAIQSALNKNVDGIIICPAQKTPDNLNYLKSSGVPFVMIGRRDESCSYVVCDDELGGFLATKELLLAGHRDILFLCGGTYISSARERLEGYRRAFREAGVAVNEKLIRTVPVVSDGCGEVLEELEKEGQGYTAVFAFSDLLAWEVWRCLAERGKRVPEDCSLIGFDHIESRLRLPLGLTSVNSYKKKMSETVVDVLVRQMKGQTQIRQIVVDAKLAAGRTVRKL